MRVGLRRTVGVSSEVLWSFTYATVYRRIDVYGQSASLTPLVGGKGGRPGR